MDDKFGDNQEEKTSMTREGSRHTVQRILGQDDVARLRKYGFVIVQKSRQESWVHGLRSRERRAEQNVQGTACRFNSGMPSKRLDENGIDRRRLEKPGTDVTHECSPRELNQVKSVIQEKIVPDETEGGIGGLGRRAGALDFTFSVELLKGAKPRECEQKSVLEKWCMEKPMLIEGFYALKEAFFDMGRKLAMLLPQRPLVFVVFGAHVHYNRSPSSSPSGLESSRNEEQGSSSSGSDDEGAENGSLGLSLSESDSDSDRRDGSRTKEEDESMGDAGNDVSTGTETAQKDVGHTSFLSPTLSHDDSPVRPPILSPLVDVRPVFVPLAERQARARQQLLRESDSLVPPAETSIFASSQVLSGIPGGSSSRSSEEYSGRQTTKRAAPDDADPFSVPSKSPKLQTFAADKKNELPVSSSLFSSPDSEDSESGQNKQPSGSLFSPGSDSDSSLPKKPKPYSPAGDIGFFSVKKAVNGDPVNKPTGSFFSPPEARPGPSNEVSKAPQESLFSPEQIREASGLFGANIPKLPDWQTLFDSPVKKPTRLSSSSSEFAFETPPKAKGANANLGELPKSHDTPTGRPSTSGVVSGGLDAQLRVPKAPSHVSSSSSEFLFGRSPTNSGRHRRELNPTRQDRPSASGAMYGGSDAQSHVPRPPSRRSSDLSFGPSPRGFSDAGKQQKNYDTSLQGRPSTSGGFYGGERAQPRGSRSGDGWEQNGVGDPSTVPPTPKPTPSDAYSGGFGGNAFVATEWQSSSSQRSARRSPSASAFSDWSTTSFNCLCAPPMNASVPWCPAGEEHCAFCPMHGRLSNCDTSSGSYCSSRPTASVSDCAGCPPSSRSASEAAANSFTKPPTVPSDPTFDTQRSSVIKMSFKAVDNTMEPFIPAKKQKMQVDEAGEGGSSSSGSSTLIDSGSSSTTIVEVSPGGVCLYGDPFPVDEKPVKNDVDKGRLKRKRKAYEGLHKDPGLKRYMENMQGLPTKTIDEYDMLQKIGQGTFGEVFKALRKETKEIVALKKIQLHQADQVGVSRPAPADGLCVKGQSTPKIPATSVREIRILTSLAHPNVLKLLDMARSSPAPMYGNRSFLYLVLEYCDHDLVGLVNQREIPLPDGVIKEIMWQLLNGLYYIHAQFVLHRDLKLANILVTRHGVIKIADFGLARWYDPHDTTRVMSNGVVTLWYRPPELLLGSMRYDDRIDTWAAGCMMAEIFLKEPLFPGRDELDQIDVIQNICGAVRPDDFPESGLMGMMQTILNRQPAMPQPRQVKQRLSRTIRDRSALDLIDRLLIMDPRKRFNSDDALMHDYFFTPPARSSLETFVGQLKEHHHEWESKRRQPAAIAPTQQQAAQWRVPPPGIMVPRPHGGTRAPPGPLRGHPGGPFRGNMRPPPGHPGGGAQPPMLRRGMPPPRPPAPGPSRGAGPSMNYMQPSNPGSNRQMEESIAPHQGPSGRRQAARRPPSRGPGGGGDGGGGRGGRGPNRSTASRGNDGRRTGDGFSEIIY